ncbi:TRAP transporter substrate-binding protein DctP [Salinarimonas soli]|uniref:C4-dicarboxylate ABC transporter n=1 Tax=Salinarimonas soli TaxID=1638099 RepID=A0A5B2V7C2_9HYPH|nr:TRAP transporter substrate-binding protein DctP [Salinarimonas soli]KAA2234871.1 C4-dicarboxylate ABC transporter [Salinarimonas soli]
MTMSRRSLLQAALAAPAVIGFARQAHAAQTLKISHQFPGGTVDEGDFRDRLCRKFAQELEKRSNGGLVAQVYPGSSLMKTNSQFSALRKGALDLSFYPLPYAGGEVVETNIGLMPCLVTSYEQAAAWKKAPIGRKITEIMNAKGIVMVSWVWQSGGVASRERPLLSPEDAKGMKVRGGSREFDLMLKAAGAATLSLPSNESYAAMQTGACDAVVTSSTSLISFHLDELSKGFTSGQGRSFWFMLEPLMMSKTIFDALPKPQQDLIMQIGEEMESFGTEGAKADDKQVEEVFRKAGAKVVVMDEPTLGKWRTIARDTAWKDYANRNATCAELLKLAEGMA